MIGRTASSFQNTYDSLRTSLLDQHCLYVDETGWRQSGENGWLWSFSNEDVSYYTIQKSRGSRVMDETLGEAFSGILVSDFWPAYSKFDSKKQKCWVHMMREVRVMRIEHPKNRSIQHFSSELKRFYEEACRLQKEYQRGRGIGRPFNLLKDKLYDLLLKKHTHPQLRILAKRLFNHRGELFTFVTEGISGTNNAAEREIRPAVLMRKTSYGNRSAQGAENQAILMSVIRTAQKKEQNFISMATEHLKFSGN